ncbi:MAG: cellulose 1,4-beta-cellobiosidase [Oscillospiraceae bacterium]|nr:cellulose 1,4-beta-cellobiosidase [Oscillospiraceae bacterium]
MLFKKSKAVIAAVLSAATLTSTMAATVANAATNIGGTPGQRSKPNAFGDSTYAERFLSLYDDVVTNGQQNGYLSSNDGGAGSFGIPYHAVEEVIIEAPDYGHETTSEAMSYLVWAAAMRDNIAKNHADQVKTGNVQYTNDLAKAWKTMEVMIPDVQDNFWTAGNVSAQYCGEYDLPNQCPDEWASEPDKTASNPIYNYFTSVYKGKSNGGLYLMHWLADVDNWYGYGTGTNFTFINTFQRGEQESCWETVPHPCVEELKYGNSQRGLKGIFNRDAQVTPQYAYTNAPDAEDRAIQGVFDANQWGVEDTNVSAKAAEMGDELRNNMYDKYYQTIGENTSWNNGNAGADSAHYLMNWYTSWGGALQSSGQNWCWQIGCSHCHEFYQNPLAAFALIQDSSLKSGMKAQGAVEDYTKSLERQMEFYLWLQSANGPIAGGATNSWKGRYEAYPSGKSTFYGMAYWDHPVYGDPVSNNWIGNQVWAVQRLSELYYWVKTNGDTTGVKPGGMTLEAALEQILDKWCAWFINNSVLTDDGDYYIPTGLTWSGQPDTWDGAPTGNTGLTCEVNGYGNGDFGCVSSLANTLIYYAKAKGVTAADVQGKTYDVGGAYPSSSVTITGNAQITKGSKSYSAGDADTAKAGLYLAQQLLDREWKIGRDDIGLTRLDHNGSLARFFSQEVWVSPSYTGTMPNGDTIANGATFLSLRTMYEGNCAGAKTSSEALAIVEELREAYKKDVANGADWSGATSELSASSAEGAAALAKFENVGAVDLYYHRFWHAGDIMMALGDMATLYPELTPTTGEETPTESETESETTGDILWGDADCNGIVNILDVITLNKSVMGKESLTTQGKLNADVDQSGTPDSTDSLNILKLIVGLYTQANFPIK